MNLKEFVHDFKNDIPVDDQSLRALSSFQQDYENFSPKESLIRKRHWGLIALLLGTIALSLYIISMK